MDKIAKERIKAALIKDLIKLMPDDLAAHNSVMALRKELKDTGHDPEIADINGWLMGVTWCKEQILETLGYKIIE